MEKRHEGFIKGLLVGILLIPLLIFGGGIFNQLGKFDSEGWTFLTIFLSPFIVVIPGIAGYFLTNNKDKKNIKIVDILIIITVLLALLLGLFYLASRF